jgi:hypothetical protein
VIADPGEEKDRAEQDDHEIGEFDANLPPSGSGVPATPIAQMAMVKLVVLGVLDRRDYATVFARNGASISSVWLTFRVCGWLR